MKKIVLFLFATLVMAACGDKGGGVSPTENFDYAPKSFSNLAATAQTIKVDVTTDVNYEVESIDQQWVKVSETETSTEAEQYFDVEANTSGADRAAKITFLTEGGNRHAVTVSQLKEGTVPPPDPAFNAAYSDEELADTAGEFVVTVTHTKAFTATIDTKSTWIREKSKVETGTNETTITYTIDRNPSRVRTGKITLTSQGFPNVVVDVAQKHHVSTDMSKDGHVRTLQTATLSGNVTNGIDLIFIGDGYTDWDIEDGTYDEVLERGINHFFALEPFKSYKNRFNIYIVTAVSHSGNFGTTSSANSDTALGCYLNGNIGGNRSKCETYTLKAIASNRLNEALTIAVANTPSHVGLCDWNKLGIPTGTDYGSGWAVDYSGTGVSDADYAQLIQHEAGHGFAKLADEYIYSGYGAAPANPYEKDRQTKYGWCKNIQFSTAKPEGTALWQKFIDDTDYQAGEPAPVFTPSIYEGATYKTGAWRSTLFSMMGSRVQKFNAPSREAIYHRIRTLSEGAAYTYDFATFKAYDKSVNFGTPATRALEAPLVPDVMSIPTPSPTFN
jgi:hypothetical protein